MPCACQKWNINILILWYILKAAVCQRRQAGHKCALWAAVGGQGWAANAAVNSAAERPANYLHCIGRLGWMRAAHRMSVWHRMLVVQRWNTASSPASTGRSAGWTVSIQRLLLVEFVKIKINRASMAGEKTMSHGPGRRLESGGRGTLCESFEIAICAIRERVRA